MPPTERVQPYPTATTNAANSALSANTAISCPFHAVGTTCSADQNSDSPQACTYKNAGPGWLNLYRE